MKAVIEKKYGKFRIKSIGATPTVVGWGGTISEAQADFKKSVKSMISYCKGEKWEIECLDCKSIDYSGLTSNKSAVEKLKEAIYNWTPVLSHEDSDLLVELGWNSLYVGGFTHEQAESFKSTLLEFARVEAIKELKEYDKIRVEIECKVVGIATVYTEKNTLWAIFKDCKLDNFKLSTAIKNRGYYLSKID